MNLIQHLRYFVAVAEHRHFGRAADSLGVTQPPVSQGLRRLERHLGLQLIERTADGAKVTEAGAMLLPRARLIVDDTSLLLSEAQQLFGGLQGLRWGAVPQLDDELLARCVTALRQTLTPTSAPPLTVTRSAVELIADIRCGAIDLAVVTHPLLVDGLAAGPVITLPRSVVLPMAHRAAAQTKAPRAQVLEDLRLAIAPRESNPAEHDLLLDALRRRGLDPVAVPASTHREVAAAVAAGHCFGLATPTAPVHTGTVHRRMLVDDVVLRVRIVAAAGRDLDRQVYAVDRELLRAAS